MRVDSSLDLWLSNGIFIIAMRCVVPEKTAFFRRGAPVLAPLGFGSGSARLGSAQSGSPLGASGFR